MMKFEIYYCIGLKVGGGIIEVVSKIISGFQLIDGDDDVKNNNDGNDNYDLNGTLLKAK